MLNEEAEAKGGSYVYKREFVSCWEKFAANPSYETAVEFLEGAPEYGSLIFSFLAGSCPGGKYYRHNLRTAIEFPIEDYRLDMSMREIPGLRELTEDEYQVFRRDSLEEVIYHVPPTEFVGRTWKMMVGAMEGKLYQIGGSVELDSEKETADLAQDVYRHCEWSLGTPTQQQRGLFIWDTSEGTVVFQFACVAGSYVANLYVASEAKERFGNS